jgi:alanine dehydrogenase
MTKKKYNLYRKSTVMKIGIPKEIKTNEDRVSVTPGGVYELVTHGHEVFIQAGAGVGSGFSDSDYFRLGATILPSIEDVYGKTDIIVKVKEPVESEYKLVREGQVVFTYFHFASSQILTEAMLKSKAVCVAYETVAMPDNSLPLLIPMSEVAGRMSIQQGAKYLEKPQSGKGILLGGVPGVRPAQVLIIGGGVVGTQAARIAAGMGAMVTILDKNLARLRYLSDIMPANVITQYSNEYVIGQLIKRSDLIVGAVLSPGAKAPVVITRNMLRDMKPGTVLVDVSIDQGGCFETSRPTTHKDPVYLVEGVVHYCVANIPGAVPMTSTLALTNATLPYLLNLADMGWEKACTHYNDLRKGLNIVNGKIVHKGVADAFGMEYTPY